jgi:hypothetical protein
VTFPVESFRAGTKADEQLVIWHADDPDGPYVATFGEVHDVLKRADFGQIPGYIEADREEIVAALLDFVHDVEQEYAARADVNHRG